ncbi:hypothetical protein ACFLQN_03810 [Candidatus Aenigmatarchaeota archaeon]
MRNLEDTINMIAEGKKKGKKNKKDLFMKDVERIENMGNKKASDTIIEEKRRRLFHKEEVPVKKETKPIETTPAETKPIETRFIETKPVTTETSKETPAEKKKTDEVPSDKYTKNEDEKKAPFDKKPIEKVEKKKTDEKTNDTQGASPQPTPVNPKSENEDEKKTSFDIDKDNKNEKKHFSFKHKHDKMPEKKIEIIKHIEYNKATESYAFDFMKQDEGGKSRIISTKIDDLYSLVIEKKVVDLGEAMKTLGIREHEAEKWAKILEENKLIEIYYPAFGKIKLHLPGSYRNVKKVKKWEKH